MKLTSSAFADGELIPPKYTCDGADVSPPIAWTDVPPAARSLALIADDPDAPGGVFVHWVVYGIPPAEKGLPEAYGTRDATAGSVHEGKNDFGRIGYGGPCPPSGTHRYYFRLYALSQDLSNLRPGVTRPELDNEIKGHVIAEAQLMGRYERKQRSSPA